MHFLVLTDEDGKPWTLAVSVLRDFSEGEAPGGGVGTWIGVAEWPHRGFVQETVEEITAALEAIGAVVQPVRTPTMPTITKAPDAPLTTAELRDCVLPWLSTHLGRPTEDLTGPRRTKPLVRARAQAVVIVRSAFGTPFETLGEVFNRHHSTMWWAAGRDEATRGGNAAREIVAGAKELRLFVAKWRAAQCEGRKRDS